MGADNKFISNKPTILSSVNNIKNVQIGVVSNISDPLSLGRIQVKIPGFARKGGDNSVDVEELPWCHPMVPKFFTSTPRVGEGVFIITFSDEKSNADRLYLGPIISELTNLNNDPIGSTGLNQFTFGLIAPNVNLNSVPAIKGVFPKSDDIAIQGRYNTDILLRKNEILIRAGKFVESLPNENNPYSFQFNTETQGYIHIRNSIPLEKATDNKEQNYGSVVNIIGNKINLLTHKDGTPRFNLANQENQISDEEILNVLENAHPLPFGDLLVQYLKLLKTAFINHVHNNNGKPPTDLVTDGNQQSVLEFKKNAEDLETRMLSRNIHIN